MHVLILGCGGFIGSHLIDRLLREGRDRVTGFDRTDYKIGRHLDSPAFRFYKQDIYADLAAVEDAVRASDAVVFLATLCNPSLYVLEPLNTIRSNYNDPVRIADLCVRHRTWFINVSTCEVYGRTVSSYAEDGYRTPALYVQKEGVTPLVLGPVANLRWSYAAAKQLFDRYLFGCEVEHGLPFTILRPYNFFGPRMDYIPERDGHGIPRVVACFMQALLSGEPIRLVDGGRARRTITCIDDAIDAFVLILRQPDRATGRIFNIGNPANEVTIRELAEAFCQVYAEITGMEAYRRHPMEDVPSATFYGRGYEDCDRRVPDISAITEAVGWRPRVGLTETLQRTLRFYHETYGDGACSS